MKKLRISTTITAILGFLSLIALVVMYLALSDIYQETDTTLEWKVVQFCWIIILLFTGSAAFTISYLFKIPGFLEDNKE